MRRFLDEIGSPFVGAYFDVGNIVYVGYPDQWIEILGGRIKKLHFCDYRADQAGLGAFVDLLAGDVDFFAVMRAIRAVGYDDYATVEFLPNYKAFPYQVHSATPACRWTRFWCSDTADSLIWRGSFFARLCRSPLEIALLFLRCGFLPDEKISRAKSKASSVPEHSPSDHKEVTA